MRRNKCVLQAGRKNVASRYNQSPEGFGGKGEGWNWKGKQEPDPKGSGQSFCHPAISNISTEQPAECCGILL